MSSTDAIKRIGILTGGGDAPGLNAVIRAAVKSTILQHGWDVLGIMHGFDGLLGSRESVFSLTYESVRGLLHRGGTILGTSTRGDPFAYPVTDGPDGQTRVIDASGRLLRRLEELEIDALIVIGGDGTMRIARRLSELGVRVVGVPKTIDNDLQATDRTFGFHTAVSTAVDAIDRLHTTAESHDRAMILEVMGRNAGWIALYSGVAGGTDAILIPEIPYRIEAVAEKLERRRVQGILFATIVVAEGARPIDGGQAVAEIAQPGGLQRLGGAGTRFAAELQAICDIETRVTVLGHVQRGGTPDATDRILATGFGVAAVELLAEEKWGHMVALRGTEIVPVPLVDIEGERLIEPDRSQLLAAARAIGITLGE